MARNNDLYRKLRSGGAGHNAALVLSDPELDAVACSAVVDAAALTAPADIAATYTEAEVQALRNDAAALRTTVNALLASLRAGGVVSS